MVLCCAVLCCALPSSRCTSTPVFLPSAGFHDGSAVHVVCCVVLCCLHTLFASAFCFAVQGLLECWAQGVCSSTAGPVGVARAGGLASS